MAGVTRNLLERRVPHVLAIYAGASWGLVQFTDFMVDEFLLSPHWTRFSLTVFLLLVPSVFMLAWFHGREGRNKVPLTEKIGIPANFAVAAGVLLFVFGGRDLGAATTEVTVETEDGEVVERVVPKPEFRKRTVLFPFDAGPGLDEDEDWVTYMVPLALEIDLAADDFFEPVSFAFLTQRLRERGFTALRDVPLALKREVSAEFFADFVAAGTLDRAEGDYRATLTLHDVGNGSRVSETVHEGPDLLSLIDEMSAVVLDALDIPRRDEVEDLPVRERFTENAAAWEAFGRAAVALFGIPPALDAALEQLQLATSLDPTFAMAQYQLGLLLLLTNRAQEAVAPMQAAIDHLYRLPERSRFGLKSDYYYITQQPEKAWAVLEMWVELHPEDPAALRNYLLVQTIRADWEGALGTLGTLLRLNPDDLSLLRQIATVHLRLGNDDEALSTLERYVEQGPDDYSGYFDLARLRRRRGEHATARELLDRALVLAPGRVELVSELALLDRNVGLFDEARVGYERALDLARTPDQRAEVLDDLKGFHRFRGQLEDAIRLTDAWLDEVSQVSAPMQIVQEQLPDIDLYLDAGRHDDAVALFGTLASQLQPPLSDFDIPYWQIHLALGAGDTDAARGAYHAAMDAIEAHDMGARRPRLIADLARIEEREGDYESAVANFREAVRLAPTRNHHREIGAALRKAGRLDEAEAELREALRLVPADPRAHLELARVLETRGDAEGAREHLQSALSAWESADETFEPAREAREKLAGLSG